MTSAEQQPGPNAWADAIWRRSSACGESACIEVAVRNGFVAVRDSKTRPGAPLVMTEAEWSAFIAGVKSGEFDL